MVEPSSPTMRLQKPKENDSPTLKIKNQGIEDDGYPQNPFGHASNRSIYLIETEEAQALINENPENLRVVNCTWYIRGLGDSKAEHLAARLTKTTQHLNLDDVSDSSNPLPQMLCSAEHWTEHMKKLRVRKTDNILLYDNQGVFSVCRLALMFRYFGAKQVRIINGGLKKWLQEGRPVYAGDYDHGEGLEGEGDYSYHVINEDIFVRDISVVHEAARRCFN